jgi:predicted O-methyltransferase YrrM
MPRTLFAQLAESATSSDTEWFRQHAYDPPFLKAISEEDGSLMCEWHVATRERHPNSGSSGGEMMTMPISMIMSSEIRRAVQCGDYVGFSTLLLGMIGHYLDRTRVLYTVEIDPGPSEHTRGWVERSGLSHLVHVAVHDSSDPVCVAEAHEFLGSAPDLVCIDSTHQYDHTRAELAQRWNELLPGGLLVLDDASGWAASYDRTDKGGSHRAATEFSRLYAPNSASFNAALCPESQASLVYSDVDRFGLYQKPYAFSSKAR